MEKSLANKKLTFNQKWDNTIKVLRNSKKIRRTVKLEVMQPEEYIQVGSKNWLVTSTKFYNKLNEKIVRAKWYHHSLFKDKELHALIVKYYLKNKDSKIRFNVADLEKFKQNYILYTNHYKWLRERGSPRYYIRRIDNGMPNNVMQSGVITKQERFFKREKIYKVPEVLINEEVAVVEKEKLLKSIAKARTLLLETPEILIFYKNYLFQKLEYQTLFKLIFFGERTYLDEMNSQYRLHKHYLSYDKLFRQYVYLRPSLNTEEDWLSFTTQDDVIEFVHTWQQLNRTAFHRSLMQAKYVENRFLLWFFGKPYKPFIYKNEKYLKNNYLVTKYKNERLFFLNLVQRYEDSQHCPIAIARETMYPGYGMLEEVPVARKYIIRIAAQYVLGRYLPIRADYDGLLTGEAENLREKRIHRFYPNRMTYRKVLDTRTSYQMYTRNTLFINRNKPSIYRRDGMLQDMILNLNQKFVESKNDIVLSNNKSIPEILVPETEFNYLFALIVSVGIGTMILFIISKIWFKIDKYKTFNVKFSLVKFGLNFIYKVLYLWIEYFENRNNKK